MGIGEVGDTRKVDNFDTRVAVEGGNRRFDAAEEERGSRRTLGAGVGCDTGVRETWGKNSTALPAENIDGDGRIV